MGAVVGAVLVQGVEEGAGLLGYKQAPVVAGYWFWFRLLHTFVFLYFGQLGVVPRSLPPDSHHLSFVLVCTSHFHEREVGGEAMVHCGRSSMGTLGYSCFMCPVGYSASL